MSDISFATETTDRSTKVASAVGDRLVQEAPADKPALASQRLVLAEMRGTNSGLPSGFPAADSVLVGAAQADQPDPQMRADSIKKLFESNLSRLDQDQNGYVSSVEVDAAMINDDFRGKDAQLLRVLKENMSELEGLSNDEWGGETSGITRMDIDQLDQIQLKPKADRSPSDEDVLADVNWSLRESGLALEGASHDLFADQADPIQSITPEAVNQGISGDCYFMAPLGALAEANPQTIKDMIVTNADGTYTVTFPGDPSHPVTVAAPTDGELATYAHGGAHGTWPAVLEKAYGTYTNENRYFSSTTVPADALDGGSFFTPGVDMLSQQGSDGDYVSLTRDSTIESKLTDALAKHQVVTAQTYASLLTDLLEYVGAMDGSTAGGLVRGHDFSVISYDPAAQTVTLRNPWGQGEPAQDGRALDGADDGFFEMSLDEFRRNFYQITYGQGEDDSASR